MAPGTSAGTLGQMASVPSLDLAALRLAFSSGRTTPRSVITELYPRLQAAGAVFLHLVPLDALLERCAELEAQPESARGAMWGVPFAVKDNVDVAGVPTTAACPAFSYVPKTSAPAVEAVMREGELNSGPRAWFSCCARQQPGLGKGIDPRFFGVQIVDRMPGNVTGALQSPEKPLPQHLHTDCLSF